MTRLENGLKFGLFLDVQAERKITIQFILRPKPSPMPCHFFFPVDALIWNERVWLTIGWIGDQAGIIITKIEIDISILRCQYPLFCGE